MITFRPEQFRQLEAAGQQRFECNALVHLREQFADRFAEFGEVPCQALLQHALREAAQHGFTVQPEVLKYINLVFEYGPTFGKAEHFDWAHEILTDGFADRIERLYAAALAHSSDEG